jgi:hypothetical protein
MHLYACHALHAYARNKNGSDESHTPNLHLAACDRNDTRV